MKRVLFIIAQEGFRDEELKKPLEVLDRGGIGYDVASISTDLAFGKLGMQYSPDLAVKDAKVEDYEGVCVVGGPGAPELANYPEVMSLLKSFHAKGKVIASICIAPTILAKAGLLEGKNCTVFPDPEAIELLKKSGAHYKEEDVVEDGLLLTASGPAVAEKFGVALKQKIR